MDNRFNRRVLTALAALASFAVHAEETPAEAAKKYATGGEVSSFRFIKGGVGHTAFVHTFTNTTEVAKFKNRFGRNLPVRILAVGGGGAGMDGTIYEYRDLRPGGGGGGGGGVTEMMVSLTSGDELSIRVGAGGGILSHQYGNARGTAGSSSISNGTEEVVLVPGGGAGGGSSGYNTHTLSTVGAAGGGGSSMNFEASAALAGASGSYESSVLNSEGIAEIPLGAPFKGGDGRASSSIAYGGGGGGAGSAGDGEKGGAGLLCDITGVAVVYGSGGGGGGTLRLGMGKDKLSHCDGGEGGLNAGRGGKVTWTVVEDDGAVVTNVYLTAATMPVANTGSGGAGGVSLRHDGANIYVDEVKSDVNTKAYYATRGADGVVVIRYDIPDAPCVGGDIVTAITNGFNVTYIHTFTNASKVSTFKPSFMFNGTSVRLLAVGGGGAGMDGTILTGNNTEVRPGGGGGGGGRVTEMNQQLAWGEEWVVGVGAGGGVPTSHGYGYARGLAGSSFVSNGVVEIVLAQGGGSGGGGGNNPHALAGDGASGGGGSNAGSYHAVKNAGGKGLWPSFVFDEYGVAVIPEGAPFSGGYGSTSASSGAYGGGGGGAGANAEGKEGGIGLVSYITGSPVVYGSGGGGGGTLRLAAGKGNAYSDGGVGGANAGCGGGLSYKEEGGGVNIYLTPATYPVANTGSGGAGGVSIRPNNAKVYVGEEEVDTSKANHNACHATPGADGVVIIRYDAVLDHPLGTVIVVR